MIDVNDFAFRQFIVDVDQSSGGVLGEIGFDLNADVSFRAIDILKLADTGIELVLIENLTGFVLDGWLEFIA